MRHVLVLLLALSLAGGSTALSLTAPLAPVPTPGLRGELSRALDACAGAPACVAETTARVSDALIADLQAIPTGREGLRASVDAALRIGGHEPAPFTSTRSPTLEAAILRLYDHVDFAPDAATRVSVAAQAGALAPAQAQAIARIVDAVADAHAASPRILAPADVALLTDDLATTMKLVTFVGSAAGEVPAHWQAMHDARMAALARADMRLAGAVSLALVDAMVALPEILPVEGCGRALDLPLIQIGAPCDDVYEAATLNLVQIDYGGNDVYLNNAGAGIAGVGAGLSWDMGAGDDVYRAAAFAQGAAVAGVGILYDEGGRDLYNLTQFGQGFSLAGVGVLYDASDADDVYEGPNDPTSIGTKAGGLGGIGILVDEGGDDRYQQDGLDGFVYGAAGGLGLLLERGDGADTYVSRDLPITLLDEFLGEFVGPVQVSAEVSATAILLDEGGDDSYWCGDHVRQGCQGAGGVGGVALHLDLAGDDAYALGASVSPVQAGLIPVFPSGQGIAYGEGSAPPGPGFGLLRDLAGADTYAGGAWSQGYATGGVGLLLDEGGADAYAGHAPLLGGRADGETWLDGLALGIGRDTG